VSLFVTIYLIGGLATTALCVCWETHQVPAHIQAQRRYSVAVLAGAVWPLLLLGGLQLGAILALKRVKPSV
jgi:hypothetical protein